MWLLNLIKARMPLTLLCDWSAHLHMYLYTVIQPGQSTACKCANTHKQLEGGINNGFWMFDLSCLQLYFCFAIGAECSGAESCISMFYCTSNNDVISSCNFYSDFVCWRTFRTMPDWFYITIVCGC
jgi:hypothetical protein